MKEAIQEIKQLAREQRKKYAKVNVCVNLILLGVIGGVSCLIQ